MPGEREIKSLSRCPVKTQVVWNGKLTSTALVQGPSGHRPASWKNIRTSGVDLGFCEGGRTSEEETKALLDIVLINKLSKYKNIFPCLLLSFIREYEFSIPKSGYF